MMENELLAASSDQCEQHFVIPLQLQSALLACWEQLAAHVTRVATLSNPQAKAFAQGRPAEL